MISRTSSTVKLRRACQPSFFISVVEVSEMSSHKKNSKAQKGWHAWCKVLQREQRAK